MSEDEAMPYRRLWGEILITGIRDALWPSPSGPGRNNTGKTTDLIQYQARSWLGSRDFAMVCALAGVEPELIRERVEPLLTAPPDKQEAFLSALGFGGNFARAIKQRGKSRMAAKMARAA